LFIFLTQGQQTEPCLLYEQLGVEITINIPQRRIQDSGWENPRERDHLGDPGVNGRRILRYIFRKWDVGVRTESGWLRIGTGGGGHL
jgi:hypothetical protein